ncbi:type VI secretion system-associated protein VasI [Vibrio diazotrophicus]|uniref:type VI secretion system-associated protein VasI n=1 Tax=Vibrio diazotrophicus TaxID=685 RepID=UPI00142D6276|nr:type VI secretion system-associated protein VasI [Vibrio diazotrophicus]NIY93391.1 type VI secretion system-associated protein TagO [Vibrio diazotrophicus]
MNTSTYILTVLMSGILFSIQTMANDSVVSQLDRAQQCTLILERLERLSCFDQVMGTPTLLPSSTMNDDKPQAWYTAFSTALKAQPINVIEQGDKENGDAWLTLSVPQTHEQLSPVLMMSCINNISRIELALPVPLEDARIKVSVAYGPKQYWRSDDVGVLFSSARGLPAISMMKAMTKNSRLILRSNSPQIDGLQFDAGQLSKALVPLRQRCGW